MDLGDYNFHLTKSWNIISNIDKSETNTFATGKNGLLQSPKSPQNSQLHDFQKTRPSHNCASVSGFGLRGLWSHQFVTEKWWMNHSEIPTILSIKIGFEFWRVSSWWFQPIWKILVKLGIFPK